MKFPRIDYMAHPAFLPYAGKYIYDDGLIEHNIATIDRLHTQFMSIQSRSAQDAERCLQQIAAAMTAVRSHAETAGASIVAREWLGATLQWVLEDLRYEYFRWVLCDKGSPESSLSPLRCSELTTLRSDGMYVANLDDADFAQIRRLAGKFTPDLKRRVESNPEIRAVFSPSRLSPLGRAINRALSRAGVLEVLSAYKRNRMRILGTGLEYSRPMQTWHSGLYLDSGIPDGPLQYLHNDESDHLPKAMIYATTVSADTGPTELIRGSNGWARSEFLFRAHKGLDQVTLSRYTPYATGPQYRVTVRDPELRRIFMQLPRAFQGSSHFGDDVLPNSELIRELDGREFKFLSGDRGQVLVFDGGRTLHRGALVKRGERVAMQVAFVNTNDRRVRNAMNGGGPVHRFMKQVGALGRAAVRG